MRPHNEKNRIYFAADLAAAIWRLRCFGVQFVGFLRDDGRKFHRRTCGNSGHGACAGALRLADRRRRGGVRASGEFAASAADRRLTDEAPVIDVRLRYLKEPDWLTYAFSTGAEPAAERYWLFQDNRLVASGKSGTAPETAGEYLLYIDFLFPENGAVYTERAAVRLNCVEDERYAFEKALGYHDSPGLLLFAYLAPLEVVEERTMCSAFEAATDEPATDEPAALRGYLTRQLEEKRTAPTQPGESPTTSS